MKRTLTVLAVAVLVATAYVNAQVVVHTNKDEVDPTVRMHAGFTIGSEYGFGLAMRYGSQKYAFELGGGFAPLYSFWVQDFNDPLIDDEWHFDILDNFAVGAKLDIMMKNTTDRRLGLKVGVEYSTVRTYGAGMALSLQVKKDPLMFVTAGFTYFPEGDAKIRSELERRTGGIIERNDFDEFVNNTSFILSLNFFLWPG
jgi:hypothetical protein